MAICLSARDVQFNKISESEPPRKKKNSSSHLLFDPWAKVTKTLWGWTHRSVISYLSGILGAKQLVVVMMQTTFSGPKSLICFSTAARSVRSSSPSATFSTITGSNPGVSQTKKLIWIDCFVYLVSDNFDSHFSLILSHRISSMIFENKTPLSSGFSSTFSPGEQGFHRWAKLFEVNSFKRKTLLWMVKPGRQIIFTVTQFALYQLQTKAI